MSVSCCPLKRLSSSTTGRCFPVGRELMGQSNYRKCDLVGLTFFKYDLTGIVPDHLILDHEIRFMLACAMLEPPHLGPMRCHSGSINFVLVGSVLASQVVISSSSSTPTPLYFALLCYISPHFPFFTCPHFSLSTFFLSTPLPHTFPFSCLDFQQFFIMARSPRKASSRGHRRGGGGRGRGGAAAAAADGAGVGDSPSRGRGGRGRGRGVLSSPRGGRRHPSRSPSP